MSVRPRSVLTGLLLAVSLAPATVSAATPATRAKPSKPAAAPAAPATPPAATPAPKVIPIIDGRVDTREYLADTVVLARVGERELTAREYRRRWNRAWKPDLPKPDSSGRAQFLNSMIIKELLALEARRLQIQLGFEDRLEFRESRERTLASVLFQRAVIDSVTPATDAEIQQEYEKFKSTIRARHILFDDPAIAETVRRDLIAKRIGWEDAARRYSRDPASRDSGGDLGWLLYGNAPPVVAFDIWPLPVGTISPVFLDDDGYHLAQVVERNSAVPPDYNAARHIIAQNFQRYRIARRAEALQAQLRARVHLVYDADNIAYSSSRFGRFVETARGRQGGTEMTVNEALPDFEPSDTSRVLARFDGGQMTLGRFMTLLSHINAFARPDVNSPGLMRKAIDGFVLEPAQAEEAVQRGLERDPMAVRALDRKREELMVGRLYQDSVAAHIWLTPKERRKFYQEHLAAYYTFPKVEYAAMSFMQKADAETVTAMLKRGLDVRQVLADSVRLRMVGGSIRTRQQNEGGPYHKLLFEGMRPGGVELDGPARDGSWFVIQLLTYDAGRQLSYEEASEFIDKDTQAIRGEELLTAFMDRVRKRYPVWSRPEIVMSIDLSDDE